MEVEASWFTILVLKAQILKDEEMKEGNAYQRCVNGWIPETLDTDFFLSKLSMTQIRSPLDSSLDSTFRNLFTFLLPRLYSDGYRPLHQGKLAKDLKKHLYPMSLCWYNLERWVESGAMLVDIKEKC